MWKLKQFRLIRIQFEHNSNTIRLIRIQFEHNSNTIRLIRIQFEHNSNTIRLIRIHNSNNIRSKKRLFWPPRVPHNLTPEKNECESGFYKFRVREVSIFCQQKFAPGNGRESRAGWPDEFVKKSLKMLPKPFFVKMNTCTMEKVDY
jgi:hypothetical protein